MKRVRSIIAIVALLAASAAAAQSWPMKPVRVINPFAAGGGTDTFARPMAAKLSQSLGQQLIIENHGGAGGTVGAANASRATPDGYTLFMGATHHAIAESIYTKLSYNLERDFVPITVIAYVPQVVVIHPKNSFKSLKELIDYARANPGKLNYGSAGSGTAHHVAGELFKTMTGTQLVHVPYKGAGPMMSDLLAGVVDLAFDGMGTSAAQIKGGKLRPLALASGKRSGLLPDVPTSAEAGLPGFEVTTWYALWAPKGTSKEIVDKVQQEIVKMLQLPDIKELWAANAAEPGGQSPVEFEAFMKREIARWAKVVKDAGAKIDL